MGIETELKFEPPQDADLPDLDGMVVTGRREVGLVATYWDTDRCDLLHLGISLRHRVASDRSEEGWTLKLGRSTAGADDGAVVREEIDADGPPDAPPRQLARLVVAVAGGRRLRAAATVETQRRIVRLGRDLFTPSVELSYDDVLSRLGTHPGPAFQEVEAELLPDGDPEVLREVGRQLRAAGFGPSPSRSKIARVLGADAPPGATTGGVGDHGLDGRATVARYATAVVGERLRQLLLVDPDLRLGRSGEAVHDARVATRRLRSHLKLLRPALDRDRVDRLRAELKWLGGLIGDVRDADVLAAWLRTADVDDDDLDDGDDDDRADHHGAAAGSDDDPGRAALVARARDRRDFHHAMLLSALSGDRYLSLLRQLRRFADEPPVRRSARDTRAARLVRRRAGRSWRKVQRQVDRLGPDPSPEQLHAVRKRVKQARYAAQAARPLGLESSLFAKRAGRLQDVLGDLHDDVVAGRWLQEHRRQVHGGEAFIAGRLSAVADVCRRHGESSWHRSWERLDRRSATAWMR